MILGVEFQLPLSIPLSLEVWFWLWPSQGKKIPPSLLQPLLEFQGFVVFQDSGIVPSHPSLTQENIPSPKEVFLR